MGKRGFYEGYRRILKIDKLLSIKNSVSAEEIIKYFEESEGRKTGPSIATIKRDIERMRSDFDAPIEYSRRRKGWYYSNPSYRLPAMFTSESQLFAAQLTRELFVKKLPGSQTSKNAETFLENITTTTPNPYSAYNDIPNRWMTNRIIALDENSEKVDDDVWKTLCDAIRVNREVTFMYRSLGSPEPAKRKVQPYQLILGQGQWDLGHSYWNLYCYDCDKKEKRIYVLSQIKNLKITENSFRYDEANDYRNISNGVFGVYINPKVYKFQIQFYWQSADMVKNRIWGENQTIKEIQDGIELTFESCQYHAVLRWALSFGGECYPLGPEIFVKDWRYDIQLMLDHEMERNQELGLGNTLDY